MDSSIPAALLREIVGDSVPVIESTNDFETIPSRLAEYGGEFALHPEISPSTVARACRTGCIPMAYRLGHFELLLVKSHIARSVLFFPNMRISRSTRRRARGMRISIDRRPSQCLDNLVEYHGGDSCWISPMLRSSILQLTEHPREGVSFHSVEIYDGDGMVAGEVGYRCGGVYTSMSGWYSKSGGGAVQLAALGRTLERGGFSFWDLGMDMEYKRQMGARLFPRLQFLSLFHGAGERTATFPLDSVPCAALL